MLFEFEPAGLNDCFLRLSRQGVSCIVAPAGTWNGLVRLNYVTAAQQDPSAPHMVFRALDVGFDQGAFAWKGRSAPVSTSPAMVEVLLERGLVNEAEAERLLFGINAPAASGTSDDGLMLRAVLAGCTFSPIYDAAPLKSGPPRVCGFALRTLADPAAFMLDVRDGLPVLDGPARDALKRATSA